MGSSPAPYTAAGRQNLRNNVDMAASLLSTGQQVYNTIRGKWNDYFHYTITISERDPLYNEVFQWLISTNPDEKHRNITVSSGSNSGDTGPVSERDSIQPSSLIIRFNEGSSRNVLIDGHRVRVSVVQPELDAKNEYSFRLLTKIGFSTSSYVAQQAVLKKLQDILDKRGSSRKAVLRMINTWGGWTTRSDLPPRTMDSVSLPPEQKNRILEDLKRFLAAEDKYNRLAIPYHRGYMLHGPPGTGKTSLVKALANEFNLDLWYISLADLKAESSLIGLLAEVGPRSILLLEDIDTIKITHDRDSSEQGHISMGSLLNTLDGVATPHGLITVMTTNRFDILDPALTRAGRMDLVEELSYPTVNVLIDLFEHFYGKKPKWNKIKDRDLPLKNVSTSQVAEIMKRHLEDPTEASKHILELIWDM